MGRFGSQSKTATMVNQVPLGGVAPVFRVGANYRAVGEIVRRSDYPDLSSAFPRNGSINSSSISINVTCTGGWNSVDYGNGAYVAVGGSTANPQASAAYSNDGKNWVEVKLPVAGRWIGVKWGGSFFVAVTDGGTVATSTDGIAWTSRNIGATGARCLAYGGGKFLITRDASNVCYTSSDGITWTARTLPANTDWGAAVYGGSTWLIVGRGNTSAATSPDGVTWTARTLPFTTPSGTGTLVYGLGQFVAGSGSSGTATIWTSPDGIIWTVRDPGLIGYGVISNGAYGDGCILLVIGNSMNGLVSYDGVNFRQRTIGQRFSQALGYGAGQFICAANSADAYSTSIENYSESVVPSEYMYLSGTAGQFVRVK